MKIIQDLINLLVSDAEKQGVRKTENEFSLVNRSLNCFKHQGQCSRSMDMNIFKISYTSSCLKQKRNIKKKNKEKIFAKLHWTPRGIAQDLWTWKISRAHRPPCAQCRITNRIWVTSDNVSVITWRVTLFTIFCYIFTNSNKYVFILCIH